MELRQYLSVLRSRLWLILAATLLAGAVGFTTSGGSSAYEARSTLYVGARTLDAAAGDLSNDRLAALDRLALTFSKMIDSEPVATEAVQAVKDLHLDVTPDELVERTVVTPEPSTQLLYIEVRDHDPKVAAALSNALADTFVEAVQRFEPVAAEGDVPRLPAYVFERAEPPTAPVPDDQVRTTLLALLFGLLAGAASSFLLDYLDVTVRTTADVERLGLPVLGVIPALDGDAPFGDLTAPALARPRPAPRKAAARKAAAKKTAAKKAPAKRAARSRKAT